MGDVTGGRGQRTGGLNEQPKQNLSLLSHFLVECSLTPHVSYWQGPNRVLGQ